MDQKLSEAIDKVSSKTDNVSHAIDRIITEIANMKENDKKVLSQVTETNGRVTTLEKKHIRMEAIQETKMSMAKDIKSALWKIAVTVISSAIVFAGGILYAIYQAVL